MNETFPRDVKKAKGSNSLDLYEQMKNFTENSTIPPVYKELKDLMHFNQSDMVLLSPIEQYFIHRKQMPDAGYVDHYLINVWLAMQFLEEQKLCTNVSHQKSIHPNLELSLIHI